jgi:hypothetical protein
MIPSVLAKVQIFWTERAMENNSIAGRLATASIAILVIIVAGSRGTSAQSVSCADTDAGIHLGWWWAPYGFIYTPPSEPIHWDIAIDSVLGAAGQWHVGADNDAFGISPMHGKYGVSTPAFSIEDFNKSLETVPDILSREVPLPPASQLYSTGSDFTPVSPLPTKSTFTTDAMADNFGVASFRPEGIETVEERDAITMITDGTVSMAPCCLSNEFYPWQASDLVLLADRGAVSGEWLQTGSMRRSK